MHMKFTAVFNLSTMLSQFLGFCVLLCYVGQHKGFLQRDTSKFLQGLSRARSTKNYIVALRLTEKLIKAAEKITTE